MKGRRRYSTSSEESGVSAESADSDSEASSGSEVSESASDERSRRRDKKRKRHAASSDSDSEEETRRRTKKRKHKKKKRKHAKKRRRNESEEESSESKTEEEHKRSHKHRLDKHKYKSASRSPSVQEVPVTYPERAQKKERALSGGGGGARLQSVVQGRRRSSSRGHRRSCSPHPHRYYEQDERKPRFDSEEFSSRPRGAEMDRFYRGSSKDRSLRSHRHSRYELAERLEPERYSGGHEYEQAPSRDERTRGGFQHNYSQRPHKYEQEEDSYFGERPQRDRAQYNERQHYSQHDDRTRHRTGNKAGPVCLVCEEVHAGRVCRVAPATAPVPRVLNHYRPHDSERSDKRVPVKRERKRSERERGNREEKEERREREERRVEREERRSEKTERAPRRERSRPASLRREPTREPKSLSRREPPSKSPRRQELRKPRDSARDDRSDGGRNRGADKYEAEKRGRADREGKDKRESEHSPRHNEKKSRFIEEDSKNYTWGKMELKKESEPGEKDKPNFGLSGKLAADTNMVNGILLKYSEPPDAKQPKRRWRFYPFKGDKSLAILYIHRQSCFVFGRDHKAVDIPLEHPSVSKQHAALQYRATPYERPDGTQARRVRPYIIDLDSANGTFVNNKKVEPRRYVELLERDVVKFGFSQREYVLLHENSKEDDAADENQDMALTSETGVNSIATVKREKQMQKELAEDGDL